MSSRAALLLERELYRLSRSEQLAGLTETAFCSDGKGVKAHPVQNDIFHWQVTIDGLPDTQWEGGVFKLELYFDDEYDERPPEVFFRTVPFHPNVDMQTGKPCMSLIDDPDEWLPGTSIPHLLMALRTLLANPGLDYPVNMAAAEIYQSSPRLYDQLVRDCVVASRRVDVGLVPFEGEDASPITDSRPELAPLPAHLNVPVEPDVVLALPEGEVRTVSFDEYYDFWKSLATSLPMAPNVHHHINTRIPNELMFARDIAGTKVTEEQFREMMARQRDLWFGKFPAKKIAKAPRRTSRDERVDAMRQLYSKNASKGSSVVLATKLSSTSSSSAALLTHPGDVGIGTPRMGDLGDGARDAGSHLAETTGHVGEDWEIEADSLLKWTEGLDHPTMVA
ncbi:Ubiquitin-conjugating enzyme E2 U [Thoreauomyces humboldtii]|nr:Ubiquitin-conjugating enzyme E2 U [Thoreauomyces humboldtii]